MDWHPIVDIVAPHVVKIESPTGNGTGFLRYRNDNWVGIATAKHVVSEAAKWEQPIRLVHPSSPAPITLYHGRKSRVVLPHSDLDVALIVAPTHVGMSNWPDTPIEIAPESKPAKPGVAVGWLGYPHLVEDGTQCCFFAGNISTAVVSKHRYSVDGVSIHGVSGGPAFCTVVAGKGKRRPVIIGAISEYWPNRSMVGEPLPGLMVAEDVTSSVTG